MSLDVYLTDDDGKELFSANITHNLNVMAEEAGIYKCLWRPEELGFTEAWQLVNLLEAGVSRLATQKAKFEAFNAPNGWGKWEHFLPWCAAYLQACRDHPEAKVNVSR